MLVKVIAVAVSVVSGCGLSVVALAHAIYL